MSNKATKRSKPDTFSLINGSIITIICILTLYPFIYVLANSLNEGKAAMINKVYLFPHKITWDNYNAVFQTPKILNGFIVSILRTGIVTPITVLYTASVAYALSKPNLLFRKFYMRCGIVTMFASGGLIPTFLVLRYLGLYDNPLVYLFPTMFGFYYAIIFISFFQALPADLEEAAKIDGAGNIAILFRIILPLSKPVLATIALFVGVFNWNDYFYGFIYISNENLLPIQTFLYKVVAEVGANDMIAQFVPQVNTQKTITLESVRYATMIVSMLPIACVYPFLQKYFVKGMMIGAIKG